jgi:hypothetical protein
MMSAEMKVEVDFVLAALKELVGGGMVYNTRAGLPER